MKIALDIETAPVDGVEKLMPPPEVKLGDMKDPLKIKAKQDKARATQLDKAACDWKYGRVTCIGLFGSGIDIVLLQPSEKDLLIEFWENLTSIRHASDGTFSIVTWNGYNFDIPFLLWRSAINNIPCEPELISGKRYDNTGSHGQIDLMQVFVSWQTKTFMKLEAAAKIFLGECKSGDGAEAVKLWQKKEYKKLQKYCRDDTKLTWELYNRISNWIS